MATASQKRPSKVMPAETTSATPVVLKWFKSAWEMLSSTDLGPSWKSLMELWQAFKHANNFSGLSRLASDGRPACIAEQFKRACSSNFQPDLGDIASFKQECYMWWMSLQPDWRKTGGKELVRGDGDLAALAKGGPNGIVSVLAALFFWEVGKGAHVSSMWSTIVSDIECVLTEVSAK